MVETALQALGVRDAGELTSDEAFECGEFTPEEEEEPEQPPPQVVQVVPQGTEEPEEEPEAPETMEALRLVAAHYAEGVIDLEQLAENVLAAWAEGASGG